MSVMHLFANRPECEKRQIRRLHEKTRDGLYPEPSSADVMGLWTTK